jgi:hypothetical protein
VQRALRRTASIVLGMADCKENAQPSDIIWLQHILTQADGAVRVALVHESVPLDLAAVPQYLRCTAAAAAAEAAAD